MTSRNSTTLTLLMLTLVAVFVWTLAQFFAAETIIARQVKWPQSLRDLAYSLLAFFLYGFSACQTASKGITVKVTTGAGLIFLGAWQALLENLLTSVPFLASLIGLWAPVVGLGLLILGLVQLCQAHRTSQQWLNDHRLLEQNLTKVDQLTQLYNRHHFFLLSDRQLESLHRQGGKVTLLLLKMTNLRELNQNLGFEMGDQALIRVARAIQRFRSPEDLVARLGDSCFALLLPHRGVQLAQEMGRDLSRRLEHSVLTDARGQQQLCRIELKARAAPIEPPQTTESLIRKLGDPV